VTSINAPHLLEIYSCYFVSAADARLAIAKFLTSNYIAVALNAVINVLCFVSL